MREQLTGKETAVRARLLGVRVGKFVTHSKQNSILSYTTGHVSSQEDGTSGVTQKEGLSSQEDGVLEEERGRVGTSEEDPVGAGIVCFIVPFFLAYLSII